MLRFPQLAPCRVAPSSSQLALPYAPPPAPPVPSPILKIRQNPAKSVRKWGRNNNRPQPRLPPPFPFPPSKSDRNGAKMSENGTERQQVPVCPLPIPKLGRMQPDSIRKRGKATTHPQNQISQLRLIPPVFTPRFHSPPLLGLRMADSGSCEMLSGLYMAAKSRYREYGARNRNARTRDIRVSVPYISHLAKHGPPNLPYISEIAPPTTPHSLPALLQQPPRSALQSYSRSVPPRPTPSIPQDPAPRIPHHGCLSQTPSRRGSMGPCHFRPLHLK